MLFSIDISLIGALCTAAILAIAFLQVSHRWAHLSYIRYWGLALAASAIRYLWILLLPVLGSFWSGLLAEVFHAFTSLFIVMGSVRLIGRKPHYGFAAIFLIFVPIWYVFSYYFISEFWIRSIPLYFLSAGALFITARVFYRLHSRQPGFGYGSACLSALFWGIHKLDYPFLRQEEWFAPFGFLITQVLSTYLAVSLILISLNRQRGLATRMAYKAAYHADHDMLTGLPNRRAFANKLKQQIRKGVRLHILMLDIRNFRHINDAWGRETADMVLRSVAERLVDTVGLSDFVSRLGGKEFAIILLHKHSDELLREFVQRLFLRLRHPVELHGNEIRLECKIGSAEFPHDADQSDELIRSAGTALTDARVSGLRHRTFAELKTSEALGRMELQRDFFSAISNQELSVVYQPQIRLKDNKITGAEALVRWNHPRVGMVPPDVFIPMAETGELIYALGEFVLATVLEDLKTAGSDIRIAINFSPRQFTEDHLLNGLLPIIDQSGLDASRLEVEITESALFFDQEKVLPLIEQLHKRGILLSIDDFGTGYSSLSILKKLPVDRIKIDKSFVRDMMDSDSDQSMVEMMILIGRSLRLEVVAEGVENEEQLNRLKELKCDIIQGYFLGRPMPWHDFIKLI